jgi:hypothetical protein
LRRPGLAVWLKRTFALSKWAPSRPIGRVPAPIEIGVKI